MKHRKKPVVIDAVLYLGAGNTEGDPPDWLWDALESRTVKPDGDDLLIETLEGVMRVSKGDWIIQGVKGEIYPCKPDIFAATYEEVTS